LFLAFSCKEEDNTPPPPPPPAEQEFIRGADLSFLPEIESCNQVFYDSSGAQKDMLDIFKEAGCNTVRLRLWHTPPNGHSGLAEVAALSAKVKAAGMKVYLTLHYSDTWADPGKQAIPAAWNGLTLAQLRDSVYAYTEKVMTTIQPEYISIGNEINGGMLWETGRIENGNSFFQLLGQAIQAVRKVNDSTKIIIHYAGFDGSQWFFEQMASYNLNYDILGISYYPFWHGKSLITLKSTITELSMQFDKPVLVAETAYPFTLGWEDMTHNSIGLEEQLSPGYPASPQGQFEFMADMKEALTDVDDCIGFCYWGAEYVAFKGPEALDGSSWENMALFDFDNKALPVLEVFHK
jgi:arabinogalactan endo-1,4-beta-galactosidase